MRIKFWKRLDSALRHGAETELALARDWESLPEGSCPGAGQGAGRSGAKAGWRNI